MKTFLIACLGLMLVTQAEAGLRDGNHQMRIDDPPRLIYGAVDHANCNIAQKEKVAYSMKPANAGTISIGTFDPTAGSRGDGTRVVHGCGQVRVLPVYFTPNRTGDVIIRFRGESQRIWIRVR